MSIDGKSLYAIIVTAVELDRQGDRAGLHAFLDDARKLMPLVRRLDRLEDQLSSFGSPGVHGPTWKETQVKWLHKLLDFDRACTAPRWAIFPRAMVRPGPSKLTLGVRLKCLPTPN
jgi:hypothetical protein